MHRIFHILKLLKNNFINYKRKSKKKKINLNDINDKLIKIQDMCDNLEFKQNLILDYFMNPSDAKQATGALRKKQEDEIKFLKEFVRICEKYDIPYWLDYGSLLGAKRHGGFVPWDDDLDVSILESDVKYFGECFYKDHGEEFKFIPNFDDIYYPSRIVYKEDNGSFLDIYPYVDLKDRVKIRLKIGIPSSERSIPKKILYPLKKIEFEGVLVSCPNDIETYLAVKYGNWKLFPKKPPYLSGHTHIEEHKIFYKYER